MSNQLEIKIEQPISIGIKQAVQTCLDGGYIALLVLSFAMLALALGIVFLDVFHLPLAQAIYNFLI